MASNYWSCSKFADWVRGTPKPLAGTAKEWNTWERSAKKKQFRYWLAEDGLDCIQNFLNWPKNRLNSLRHYCDNRWIYKTHSLTSNLRPGHWYDFDTRMLHSAFDSLVNFVEVEQAWLHVSCSEEAHKKYGRTPFQQWRSPEAGLEYLEWAASLRYENGPDSGKLTNQALAALETIALYKWWKEMRLHRPDPSEASGWSNYCEERRRNAPDDFWLDFENETDENKARSQSIHEICKQMEDEHEQEDTEMLIRLVKLRTSLWT